MITDNQVQTLRKTAAMMLAALQHGTPPKELQAHLEAAETQSRVLEAFSKAAQAHPKALAMLESPSKGKAAAVVAVQHGRRRARGAARDGDACRPRRHASRAAESAPPTLGIVDGQIRLVTQPAWMWLLSMLNPLQPGRLRICVKCARLYVAARRDQLGCSARCGDAIFMRKYRGPNYRKRRRAAQGIAKAKDAMERRRLHLALREENQRQQQPRRLGSSEPEVQTRSMVAPDAAVPRFHSF
ncbi:MAG: hypothetical protein ACLQU2_07890 [Candidatus Binataceae bacterium]